MCDTVIPKCWICIWPNVFQKLHLIVRFSQKRKKEKKKRKKMLVWKKTTFLKKWTKSALTCYEWFADVFWGKMVCCVVLLVFSFLLIRVVYIFCFVVSLFLIKTKIKRFLRRPCDVEREKKFYNILNYWIMTANFRCICDV